MTVRDFVDMYIEPMLLTVALYDADEGDTICVEKGDELPDKYLEYNVCSYDPPSCYFTINLNVSKED